MIFRRRTQALVTLLTLATGARIVAQEDGRIHFQAIELAKVAEKHLGLPGDQVVIQQKDRGGQWHDAGEVQMAVGASPNRSGSTDETELRVTTADRNVTLVAISLEVGGVMVNAATPLDAASDLLSWLQKPTPDHYFSTLAVTPRSEMVAGEASGVGFFFAAEENQIFSEFPTVGSAHYWERYARILRVGVPRGAAMDESQIAFEGMEPLERLKQVCPYPDYIRLVQDGGAELLGAVDGMASELLGEIIRKSTSQGIVPSESAVEIVRQKRLKWSGDPNPPNLQEYLGPFLAERAGTPTDSPDPVPESPTKSQPEETPRPETATAQMPRPNRSPLWWVVEGAAAAAVIGLAAWFASKRPRK